MLTTLAAVILALAAGVSPANAAVNHAAASAQAASPLAANWPGPASLIGAVVLLAVTWGISILAAARRDNWSVSAE
jgi:hypothetical protein